MSNTQNLQQVLAKKQAVTQGDPQRVQRQRDAGKHTARERIAGLLDQGSFVELDVLVKDGGVVTGYGIVDERPVYVFAQDYTARGAAMNKAQAAKIAKVLDMAQKTGAPVVALCDSAGADLTEGAAALSAYSEIFTRMARLSGVCPLIAVVMGPCNGVAALMTQLADVAVLCEKESELMLAGPLVQSAAAGKTLTAQELGGADVMAAEGAAALTAASEEEALGLAKALLALLPACNAEDAPIVDGDDMNRLLSATQGDLAALMADLADAGTLLELFSAYGKAARVALCRLGGRSVGLVACDKSADGGRLDAAACGKVARFVRLCDCYNLPVVTLIDSEGFAVGEMGKQAWMMRAAAQMLYAYAEATTPKLAVVTGNAIGAAYVAMGGRAVADVAYAWPGAVISALTVQNAVQVLMTDELKQAGLPALEARAKLEEDYAANTADGVNAAAQGIVDDVINPIETRKLLIAAMEMLASKRDANPPKKHGNLPL